MANGNVPATATSAFYFIEGLQPINEVSALGVGSTVLYAPYPQMGAWYVVLSLKDLSVVVNDFEQWSGTPMNQIPASIQPYVGQPGYFLFFIANNLLVSGVPQGDLYNVLMKTGAGPADLPSVEQLFSQIGSENVRSFSYILGATTDPADPAGFETLSFVGHCVLAFQFMPVTVQGQTSYVPIQLG